MSIIVPKKVCWKPLVFTGDPIERDATVEKGYEGPTHSGPLALRIGYDAKTVERCL